MSVGVRGTSTSNEGASRPRHGTTENQPAPAGGSAQNITRDTSDRCPGNLAASDDQTRALEISPPRTVDTVRHGSASPTRTSRPDAIFSPIHRAARPRAGPAPMRCPPASPTPTAPARPYALTLCPNERLREHGKQRATLSLQLHAKLKQRGLPIDGVEIQSHANMLSFPSHTSHASTSIRSPPIPPGR